ncbi:MAG: hypothetical protein GY862_01265, partial [Gammaproteobacteria bacterium]|nr:hypothetical protein [Gammaproteobacteria bacterium]
RENRQSSDNDAWHDHVFLGFMDNRLAFRLPKEWRKQLRQVREQPITRFFQKVEQRLRPLMERLRVYAHNKTKPAKKKEGDPLASNATSDISVPSLPQTQESFSSLLRKYMDENAVNPGDLAVRITKETGEETHRQTLNNWLNGTPSKDQHNKVRVCARIFNLTKKQTNEFLAAAGFNEPYVLTGSFAEAIFTDYIKMLFDKLSLLNPYPVMLLLTQADWGEPPCREALLARAKKIYSPENVLDIRPAYSMSADTNEYFLDLGKQCGMAGVNNDYDFERGLKRRVEESRRLFLLVSHFEQGVKSLNKHLAGILRAVSETSSGQFHIMLCGGEELSTLKYRSGSLSLLNFAEVEHWPELSPADAKAVADYYFEELKVNEATAARLLKISGGHPRLLKECLRIHRNFSGSRYLDDKKYSEALSKNEEVYQLFMPFAQRGAEIRQTMHTWLQKERLAEFAPDIKNDLLRELYWKNLLVRRDSASGETWLHWRCPALQMGGLKILGDDDNIKQLKG